MEHMYSVCTRDAAVVLTVPLDDRYRPQPSLAYEWPRATYAYPIPRDRIRSSLLEYTKSYSVDCGMAKLMASVVAIEFRESRLTVPCNPVCNQQPRAVDPRNASGL